MNKKFTAAIGLYLLSFFLPVLQYQLGTEEVSIYGWETALDVIMNSEYAYSISENPVLITGQYILMNLTNPLILAVIILTITGKAARLRWLLGTIAMFSAIAYMPYFFTMIFTYFSFGYYLWVISILMIYFYSNESSFKRPAKNA